MSKPIFFFFFFFFFGGGGGNKKNINLLSAELAQREIKVKHPVYPALLYLWGFKLTFMYKTLQRFWCSGSEVDVKGKCKVPVDKSFNSTCRPWWLSWMHVRLETRRSRVQPRRGRQHSFLEIDHEIFSTVIPSLPLIQEWQLSVSGQRMCTILVNRLED